MVQVSSAAWSFPSTGVLAERTRMRLSTALVAVLGLGLTLGGGAALAAKPAEVNSVSPATASADFAPLDLKISPPKLEIQGRPAAHRLLVSAQATTGAAPLWNDVSALAKWTVDPPQLAEITPAGVFPKQNGVGVVRAEFAGKTTHIPLDIKDLAAVGALPPSFLEDVQPVLTRAGCNQGACHGKLAGQNGFKLSLRGYAPEWDFDWIAREYEGRRINREIPEQSLLLRKGAGEVFHKGGKLLRLDGPEYRTLLNWIQAGCPAPLKEEPRTAALEIWPASQRLAVGRPQPLVVRARYSDGTWRDVTWLAKFASNDESVLSVTPAGVATAKRSGETSIRAHFQDAVALVQFTIPFPAADAGAVAATSTPAHPFDEALFAKLGALGVPASPLCSDETFLRRAHLDLIGTLPTPDEWRAFMSDGRPTEQKRADLVDRLMARPEFVDFWALQWSDLFQNRRERDHDVRGMKGVRNFHAWLREQVAINRPWNELARDVLTARGKSADHPAVGYYIVTIGEERHGERSEAASSIAQALLGTRIGCAKCHNHPLERYTQDDYYHFAAFFSRVKFDRKSPGGGDTELVVSHPDQNQNKNPVGVHQPRTGAFLPPRGLDRKPLEIKPGDDPREQLAAWVTSPENEYFTGSIVNRLWKHFFQVGLVEPVDDLRASNPPTNPELFRRLQKELVDGKFDWKRVVRLIVTSRAYQLDSGTIPGNENDDRFYSHYYPRRLPAETLLDAMSSATQVPDRFPGYPEGVRAIHLPDSNLDSYFLTTFGRSGRVTACACERSGDVTIAQLLHLMNGDGTQGKIQQPQSRLNRLLREQKPDDVIMEELFLATLGKKPTAKQLETVKKANEGVSREEALRDLFWALLNSSEFSFNR